MATPEMKRVRRIMAHEGAALDQALAMLKGHEEQLEYLRNRGHIDFALRFGHEYADSTIKLLACLALGRLHQDAWEQMQLDRELEAGAGEPPQPPA